MSSNLPSSIRTPLVRSLLGGESVAWAIVDAHGGITESGGAWLELLEMEPSVGELLADRLDVIEGLLPAGAEVERLSRVEIRGGRFVDLHFGPLEGGTSFVLMRDVSARAIAETRLLRRANDLSLLRRALGTQLEVTQHPGRERLEALVGAREGEQEFEAWTACVRLDPSIAGPDRLRWSRWIEEWLLERSAFLQRRGRGCFLTLFGVLPEEALPARAALECMRELREGLGTAGLEAVTFSVTFGATTVSLVEDDRILWQGSSVNRAWRLARTGTRGQLLLDEEAVRADASLERECVALPGADGTWLYVAASDHIPEPAAVLAGLGTLVLRPMGGAAFRVEGSVPPWFDSVATTADELRVDEVFPFLEVFLEEAADVWSRAHRGVSHSGVWSQDDENGNELFFEATAQRTSRGSRYLLVQAIDRQIEERRALLQGLHSSRLDLERQRKSIDRREVLLHCIVHDLRGPLSNVLAALTGLGRSLEPEPTEYQRELVQLGVEQARRQDEMIRSLLEVFAAEIESLEKFEKRAESAPDGLAAVRDVGESFRASFREGGVELSVEIETRGEERSVPVVGHAGRLARVLANLLENARRHAPAGSRVRLGARAGAQRLEFEIVDQGPGVEPKVAETLFDRFRSGAGGGAVGLGLFFCRTTIERWGGRIGYEAGDDGAGARFWFWLPRAAD